MDNNVFDIALIFEGGGMRNSYSSGAVNVLLESGIFFDSVYGLSAGATNAVNYVSRDTWRSRVAFTEYIDDLTFREPLLLLVRPEKTDGTEAHVFQRKGSNVIPFDFDTFRANPAQMTLQAVDRDSGKTRYFTREDYENEASLMAAVRASTSFPVLMPPKQIDDRFYYDGGIGDGGGIMIPRAKADGLDRYFVICTHPRGFRKSGKHERIYDMYFWRRPSMRSLMESWDRRYNAQMDRLDALEAQGRAYVFYAEEQGVSNTERNEIKLKENFARGYAQAQRELGAWKEFLAISS